MQDGVVPQVQHPGHGGAPRVRIVEDFDGGPKRGIVMDDQDSSDCMAVELHQAIYREDRHALNKGLDQSRVEFTFSEEDLAR